MLLTRPQGFGRSAMKPLAIAPLLGILWSLSPAVTLPAQAEPPARRFNVVGRALMDQGNGATYTMLGVEMRAFNPEGWNCGFGMYRGLNLADQTSVDAQSQGGFLFGKDTDVGPVIVGTDVLGGMGGGIVASPTLTFSNFGVYFLVEPRISLAVRPMSIFEIRLSGSYLVTTRPNQASGPAVMLTLGYPMRHPKAPG